MTRKKLNPDGRGIASVTLTTGTAPKLPHERDESTQAMQDRPRRKMRQAHDDIVAGRSDTSRGEATDPTYRKLKR